MMTPLQSFASAVPPASAPTRRRFITRAIGSMLAPGLATGVASAMASGLALKAQAQDGPGYQVSAWSGPLPELGLLDTNGKTWQLADLQGRAVLLNFWATWCPPCRAEMPSLQIVADLYGDAKLLVLAINFKEPASRAVKFAAANGLNFPVLLDPVGKQAGQQGVKVFPTTLALGANGRPQQRVTGELDWTGRPAEALIAGLLRA